jgi:hypothetical protein
VNKTAVAAGIGPVDAGLRLELTSPATTATMSLSRAQLRELPQHTAQLPIACVEGWSTGVHTWTGVRLADLAALVGAAPDTSLFVESLQRGGGFGSATLSAAQVNVPDALLALRVNGADLTADHGFPARVLVPGALIRALAPGPCGGVREVVLPCCCLTELARRKPCGIPSAWHSPTTRCPGGSTPLNHRPSMPGLPPGHRVVALGEVDGMPHPPPTPCRT